MIDINFVLIRWYVLLSLFGFHQTSSKILITIFQVTNADQFKLPREMEMHEKLPFSWKWSNEIREADLRDNEDDSPRYEKLFE